MEISYVKDSDRKQFNILSPHPLQSWEWGEFREKTGISVFRLGIYEQGKLTQAQQITLHPIPHTKWKVGYIPKGNIPSKKMLESLQLFGKKHRCIFIKFEPAVLNNSSNTAVVFSEFPIVKSKHPLFTQYTFHLDITKTEEELLKNFHSKTRYNIKIAKKHNIEVKEDDSEKAFSEYLKLMGETTKRQQYFAHTKKYHSLMWDTLHPKGIAHLLTASYTTAHKTYTLAAWILFLFNDVLYYPYGASSNQFRNTMSSNLIMWEAILFGKKHKAKLFDMWGALGPNANPKDPWFGFHRFKQGYGAQLVECMGSFDMVINPLLYSLYNKAHVVRHEMLKIKRLFK